MVVVSSVIYRTRMRYSRSQNHIGSAPGIPPAVYSKEQNVGCVSSKSTPTVSCSRDKLNKLLVDSYGRHKELVEELKKTMLYREEAIQQMKVVADELDRKHRDANVAKLIGSGASVIGSIVGGVVLPITAGTSALATAVVVGGATAVVSGKAAFSATRKFWRASISPECKGH